MKLFELKKLIDDELSEMAGSDPDVEISDGQSDYDVLYVYRSEDGTILYIDISVEE